MVRPTLVRAVRSVGLLEGLSYFALLFIAMPLKYAMDLPMAVRVVGAAHGALFVLLGCLIASALFEGAITRKESAMVALASLVPFGPLFIDARLRAAVERAQRSVSMMHDRNEKLMRLLAMTLAFGALACGDPDPNPRTDASQADVVQSDASQSDAVPPDAGAPLIDAGPIEVDATPIEDAGPGLGTTRYVGSMPAARMELADASGNIVCRVQDNPDPTSRPVATDCPDGLFTERLFDGSGDRLSIDRPVNIHAKFTRYEDVHSDDLRIVDLTSPVDVFDEGPADLTGAPGDANFRVTCQFSHFNYDDPIVYPGEPGLAHLHMFWGNTRTDAFTTTTESLVRAGGGTCNGFELNRSAYWTPALMDGEGNALIPQQIIIYYKTKNLNEPGITEVQAMPQGLRLIAGASASSGPFTLPPSHEEQRLFWSCGRSGDVRNRSAEVPQCEEGEQLNATIYFPQCWNGVDLDSPNHRDHVARVNVGDPCPVSHPVRIPELGFLLYYEQSGDTSGWHLDSDHAHGADMVRGGSLHADWIAGWADDAMDLWLDGCIRTGRNCTLGQTGTARTLERLNGTESDSWPGPYSVVPPERPSL